MKPLYLALVSKVFSYLFIEMGVWESWTLSIIIRHNSIFDNSIFLLYAVALAFKTYYSEVSSTTVVLFTVRLETRQIVLT